MLKTSLPVSDGVSTWRDSREAQVFLRYGTAAAKKSGLQMTGRDATRRDATRRDATRRDATRRDNTVAGQRN